MQLVKLEDEAGLRRAFPVVRQLRAHLDEAEFLARVARQAAGHGYELWAAEGPQSAIVGAIGWRPVESLARGRHLHVDDLVVDAAWRGKGVGRVLLEAAERFARESGLVSVFLDSRKEVVDFYARLGYEPHTAVLMRKRLAGA